MRRKYNKVPKLHIQRGDTVKVLSGDADIKGKKGLVLAIFPAKRLAIVEDVRIVTRHVKKTQDNPRGSIRNYPAKLHISKLQLIDPANGNPTRVGRKRTDKGWSRVSVKTGELIIPISTQ